MQGGEEVESENQKEKYYIDKEGYLHWEVDKENKIKRAKEIWQKVKHADQTKQLATALEKGSLTKQQTQAIVLHRTDTDTSLQAINGFLRGVGTHFLVDTEGTIYQCASLYKWTQHVGKIRSKSKETSMRNEKERQHIKSLGNDVQALHDYEKAKSYPNRYPINSDSIGIEVVGKHKNNQWEVVTQAQKDSIKTLIEILKQEYSLTDDIYEHDKISRKTEGKGANLYP